MGQEIVYCHTCGKRLTSTDFERGKAIRANDKIVCSKCATETEMRMARPETSESKSTPRPRTHKTSRIAPQEPPPGKKSPVPILLGGIAAVVIVLVVLVAVFAGGGGDGGYQAQAIRESETPTPPPIKLNWSWVPERLSSTLGQRDHLLQFLSDPSDGTRRGRRQGVPVGRPRLLCRVRSRRGQERSSSQPGFEDTDPSTSIPADPA